MTWSPQQHASPHHFQAGDLGISYQDVIDGARDAYDFVLIGGIVAFEMRGVEDAVSSFGELITGTPERHATYEILWLASARLY